MCASSPRRLPGSSCIASMALVALALGACGDDSSPGGGTDAGGRDGAIRIDSGGATDAGGGTDSGGTGIDSGGTGVDSGGTGIDSGGTGVDSGGTGIDSGGTGVDSGGTGIDSGGTGVDSGGTGIDSGGVELDAGPMCMPTSSGACAAGLTCECCPAGGPLEHCLCSTPCMTDGDCTDPARPVCNLPVLGGGVTMPGICAPRTFTCCWFCD